MTKQSEQEELEQAKASPPFRKRFNIEIDLEKARDNFVSRVLNLIEVFLPDLQKSYHGREAKYDRILQLVATELGIRYETANRFSSYADGDFIKLLHALEAAYKVLRLYEEEIIIEKFIIHEAMSKSEVDLEIEWRNGIFIRSGAKLLDEALVNESLQWLSDPKYRDARAPFEEGLRHFTEAIKYPERLMDTIRDMYEALEKMARIVTANNKNLLDNIDEFVSMLGLDTHYSRMLKEHTGFAHKFRHAVKEGRERMPPSRQEVEAFIYTTGLFIRLAIQQSSLIAQSNQ